jgi:inorganic phosphate transporter, PiT family
MALIPGALVTGNYLQLVDGKLPIPIWVILAAHAAIALGTVSGGWRIIHTMGRRSPSCSRSAASRRKRRTPSRSSPATHLGVPVSTTHTTTGAIIGVGSIKPLSAVRWGVAEQIVWAWLLTIPASVLIAALVYRAAAILLAR